MKNLESLAYDTITLKEVVDFLPDPLLLSWNNNGVQTPFYVNSRFTEVLGYTLADIPDINAWFCHAYPDESYRQSVIAQWEEGKKSALHRNENAVEVKARIKCRNGDYKWFNVRGSLLKKDVDIVLFANIDSLESQKEDLDMTVRLKDKLFAVISHDVRSPLATLSGLLALVNDIPAEQTKLLLPSIGVQLKNVSALLNSMLEWASSQVREIKPKCIAFDPSELIKSVIQIVTHDIVAKGISVRTNLQGLTVFADPRLFEIVVRNLVGNALKFTPAGGAISIDLHRNDSNAFVTVTDTGVGLSHLQQQQIVGKQAVSSSGTNSEKGMGLGLIVSQEFIEMNGGKLGIVSEQGKGAAFTFSVPLAQNGI